MRLNCSSLCSLRIHEIMKIKHLYNSVSGEGGRADHALQPCKNKLQKKMAAEGGRIDFIIIAPSSSGWIRYSCNKLQKILTEMSSTIQLADRPIELSCFRVTH